jgi:prevent-host-death family protein
MIKVSVTEFKNNFGHYMRAVRAGKTFIITIRGKAAAKISPIATVPPHSKPRK